MKSFHSNRGALPYLDTLMDAKAAASAKPGLEESAQSMLHRIRITLTSTKVKALEQGKKS